MALARVGWKIPRIEVPTEALVQEPGWFGAAAGAWPVEKAAREGATRRRVARDAGYTAVASPGSADMTYFGVIQDGVAWEAAGNHTSWADIAGGTETS